MKLDEAIKELEEHGYLVEDTDELDDADLPAGWSKKDKADYHKHKQLSQSLKDRIIGAYEMFMQRKEKEAENSWKKNVKYRAGTNDEKDLLTTYKRCWKEDLKHKNTMTPFEFYKIMMSNSDTRDFIKRKTKDMSLYANIQYGDEDDDYEYDDPLEELKGKINYHISDFKDSCKDDWASAYYIKKALKNETSAKEVKKIFKNAIASSTTFGQFEKYLEKEWSRLAKIFDKLEDKDDNGKLTKEEKEQYKLIDLITDCIDMNQDSWWEQIKWFTDKNYEKAIKAFNFLLKNGFSTDAINEISKKFTEMKMPKKEKPKKVIKEAVPPIINVMYKSFMQKMNVPYIYRAVEVDTDWVDDQLDDMENKWHQKDKAEYLRNNKYKERMGLANVNLHSVGKSWAWNEEEASAVCGGGGDEYIIEAENDPENVDLTMSALCFAEWSSFKSNGTVDDGGECEVRVLDELQVTVTDVWTGPKKNKTHLNRKETYYREG